jgi:hypothetical protein
LTEVREIAAMFKQSTPARIVATSARYATAGAGHPTDPAG